MIIKANRRLWVLRRLRNIGASQEDLLSIYKMQVRCILEYAVSAWQGSLTESEKVALERVQKTVGVRLIDFFGTYLCRQSNLVLEVKPYLFVFNSATLGALFCTFLPFEPFFFAL